MWAPGRFDRFRGGGFGWGLSRHIQDCYRFIVQPYDSGDELFLFWFSRGAYTARSLAGLMRNAGIVRSQHSDKLDAAYALYRRGDQDSHPTANESELFRRTFAHQPATRIKFIGVWDTVGALGIPAVGAFGIPIGWLGFLNRHWRFHDVKLSSYVDNASHAIAIDEKRRWFEPTLSAAGARHAPDDGTGLVRRGA